MKTIPLTGLHLCRDFDAERSTIRAIWKNFAKPLPTRKPSLVYPDNRPTSDKVVVLEPRQDEPVPRKTPETRSRLLNKTNLSPMNEIALQIIREQWPLRNDPNPAIRQQARSLIKTHIFLLRGWQMEEAA